MKGEKKGRKKKHNSFYVWKDTGYVFPNKVTLKLGDIFTPS